MKFVEKASGWMIAIGLAIAVLLAFNYLDVFVLVGFRNSATNPAAMTMFMMIM